MKMPNTYRHKKFCDLSIITNNVSDLQIKNLLKTLVELGYAIVALNHILPVSVFEGKKKKKKKGEPRDTADLVPPPLQLGDLNKEFGAKLKILQRLTFTFSDNLQAHRLAQSENVKKYDLLAVIPTTESAFQLVYAPAIQDTTCRRNIIQTAHYYHALGKSKNIIICSGASKPLQIRGPYDVVNLGLIFGLSEEQSKAALTSTCRTLLIKAEGRHYGKTVMTIQLKTPVLTEDILAVCGNEMEVDVEPAHKRQRSDDT